MAETIWRRRRTNGCQLTGQNQKYLLFTFSSSSFNAFPALRSLNDYLKILYNMVMNQTPRLPNDEIVFLMSLSQEDFESRLLALRKAGWSLRQIGASLRPPKPKTTVHFWTNRASEKLQHREVPLPPPRSLTTSVPTKNAPRLRSISPGVPVDLKPRLRELATLARRYRAKSPAGSPLALANEELTAVAKTLRSMGVPTAAIAEAAGVSYRAMARRLSR